MRLGLVLWLAMVTVGVGRARAPPPPKDTPPKDTKEARQEELKDTQSKIHAEELLEKYGYLECVPPGSEGNIHLHRLLLYRPQRYMDTPRYHPLDFRLKDVQYDAPPSGKRIGRLEGVLGHDPLPQEDLDVPSARQDLLSLLGNSRRRSTKDSRLSVELWDPISSKFQHLPVCTEAEIQEAVKKFQAVYHVGVDGALDPATVGLLSSPRCGNPDNIMEEPEEAPQDEEQVSDQRRSRRSVVSSVKEDKPKKTSYFSKYFISSPDKASDALTAKDGEKDKKESTADKEMSKKDLEWRHGTKSHHLEVHEWEPDSSEILKRRRRWVEEMKNRIDSGEEDARLDALKNRPSLPKGGHAPGGRIKRSVFNNLGQRFNEKLLKWRLVTAGYSSQLGVNAQRSALALAFRMWSEVIPPIFNEEIDPKDDSVAISVGFGKRSHLGCVTEFDGLGGELGHTLRPAREAQIHMDDDEHFTLDSDHGTNLLKVAVHEIGHVLGLAHVVRNYSIMYSVYEKALPNVGFELGWEDRRLVQRIYGSCNGSFSTVFDFLKWRPDGTLSYNTYFFRGGHFWMYENRYNRTRFGDPLYVKYEWKGLPNDIDGYAHIWTRTKDIHLFFKGEFYYVYDPVADSVLSGYPRRIAQDFHGPPTSKRPLGRTIPSDIDSVYFDKRDENLYFFRGKKVWGYDVSKGATGCCLPGYPRRLRDEFVPATNTSRPLRRLDAAYYSYTHQTLFFIKERHYWRTTSFDPQDKRRNNSIVGPYLVHKKWYDICDTELEPLTAFGQS